MTQGSYYLEDEKFILFKIKCTQNKTSMTQKISEWVEDFIKESEPKKEKTEKLDTF